jgi:mono/diheme cytochrome c family protein
MRALGWLLPIGALCIATPLRAQASDRGKQVYDRWCSTCHAPGTRMPGTAALAAKYGAEQPAALEDRRDLTPDIVRYFVRHGVSIMPFFRKTEISDADLDAVEKYLSRSPPTKKSGRNR